MMSLLLLEQISELFLCIFLGWILVRCKLLKTTDSRILSVIIMFIICPCVIIKSFQLEYTSERVNGLKLALVGAVAVHALLFAVTYLLRKPLHLTAVEMASVIYTNSGNLIIPVVSAILGREWVLYCSMFMMVQTVLLWSHARMLLSGEKGISLKKIFGNVNVISVGIGLAVFFMQIPIPKIVSETMESMAQMVGPLSMVIVGMLIGGTSLKRIFTSLDVWKIVVLRLLVTSILVVFMLKYSGLAQLVPDGNTILLITLLAGVAPSAAMVTQISQVYGSEGQYAGSINLATTVLCIVTMPLMVALYQM